MAVKYFAWDDAKNAKLKAERGIGFEDIVFRIERGAPLNALEHPNPDRTPASASLLFRTTTCTWCPSWKTSNTIFLKNIIPSRKATKQYLDEESDHED